MEDMNERCTHKIEMKKQGKLIIIKKKNENTKPIDRCKMHAVKMTTCHFYAI